MTTVTINRLIALLFSIILCACLVLTAWAFTKAIMFGVIALLCTAGVGYFAYHDITRLKNKDK